MQIARRRSRPKAGAGRQPQPGMPTFKIASAAPVIVKTSAIAR
jgi:hypothetical protein